MIGLDTNILIRYLVQDEPIQSKKAVSEIEKGLSSGCTFFIADIVLCELVWVLETAYGYERPKISMVLDRILRTKQFQFTDKDVLWQSLNDYKNKKGDFSDHLIGWSGRRAGCRETLTFDSACKNNPLFRML